MSIGPTELIICLILLIPIVFILVVVFTARKSNQNKRRIPCPNCAELILPEAKVCRFCGHSLDHQQPMM